MRSYLRHRYALAVPFLSLVLVTLVGGQLWGVDARGVVVDDSSGEPVPKVIVKYGSRSAVSGPDGAYELRGLPRDARLNAQAPGYSRTNAAAEARELRLLPLTLTFELDEEGTTPPKGVPFPQARQNQRQIGSGNKDGSMVVGPYPERNLPVLLCAENFESQEVLPKGVVMALTMKRKEGGACPPLPSPSVPPAQVPSPSPSASPSARPSPSPSPTAR